MIAIILIALAAGCASALMFASMISGVLISILLIYLAPLPLMVAALGWGPLCATIGGIAAATVLGRRSALDRSRHRDPDRRRRGLGAGGRPGRGRLRHVHGDRQ